MQDQVDWIVIKIRGNDESINAFTQYWWTWSNRHLRRSNTFPEGRFESDLEALNITILTNDSISLQTFEILVKKFNRLRFTLFAKNFSCENRHALIYQNAKKVKHFHKYSEVKKLNENDHIIIYYLADHVRKKLKILGKYIAEGKGYFDKTFYVIYENYFIDYVEEEAKNDEQSID